MKKYESELMKSLYEEAKYFHSKGIISADEMKEYDEDCLVSTADIAGATIRGRSPLVAAAIGSAPHGRSVK
jgi:DNA-binding transcriptional regulator YiaG